MPQRLLHCSASWTRWKASGGATRGARTLGGQKRAVGTSRSGLDVSAETSGVSPQEASGASPGGSTSPGGAPVRIWPLNQIGPWHHRRMGRRSLVGAGQPVDHRGSLVSLPVRAKAQHQTPHDHPGRRPQPGGGLAPTGTGDLRAGAHDNPAVGLWHLSPAPIPEGLASVPPTHERACKLARIRQTGRPFTMHSPLTQAPFRALASMVVVLALLTTGCGRNRLAVKSPGGRAQLTAPTPGRACWSRLCPFV